ncbi:MAG: glycine-rich domain-containing protein [Zwartia sp.]
MAILQFANNASSTLAQNITGVDTTIYLAAGEGSLFPTPTATQVFYATIYNTSSTLWEIVLVTARTNDTLTVIRAQEGTTAQTWLVGDSLGMYPTAATMNQMIQIDQLQNGKYTIAQAGGTANDLTCQITSDLTSIPDGMTLVLKPAYANTDAVTLQVTIGSTILSAVPVVKGPNLALEATDIPSAGYPVQLIYSVIYGAWVMQMPSTLISPPTPPTYSIDYLAIDGGGGGNGNSGGGGGAGGFITGTYSALVGNTFIITIGGGGAGQNSNTPNNGTPSSISGIAFGTGGGGGGWASYGGSYPGRNGSSGGGGGGGIGGSGVGAAGGTGVPGIGNNGGTGSNDNGSSGGCAGGGGGAGDVGGNGIGATTGGAGGVGRTSSITGSAIYYAGGGGGGSGNAVAAVAPGGLGGGGNGGNNVFGAAATPGAVNSGGGGGGGGFGNIGGNGGSGVVILSMATTRYTGVTTGGPTVTSYGSTTVVKFTSSGTYTS